MLKNSEYFPAITEKKGLIAVLFLSPPAGSGDFVDWYWRAIAGVPFLLRNILNIQRGGVERLVLITGLLPREKCFLFAGYRKQRARPVLSSIRIDCANPLIHGNH